MVEVESVMVILDSVFASHLLIASDVTHVLTEPTIYRNPTSLVVNVRGYRYSDIKKKKFNLP